MTKSQGKTDGRVVVFILFAGAFLLWGIVFLTGLGEKRRLGRDGHLGGSAGENLRDSTAQPDSLRAWMSRLPPEWVKVTKVEGQGFVLLVPCYTSNSTLSFHEPADSLPQVECEYCDSLAQYSVIGMAKARNDSAWELHLNPPAGNVEILAVSDTLLKRFPEAPFQDRILFWTRARLGGVGDSAAIDTMFFVPKTQENEFEVLRAEDENPEGCGTQSE